ncbi:MAG: hypothetical protein JWN67_2359 [Actinomycetia bacterium]|nr:hypothetical protein [Actinomycetes bacterium]
MTARRRNRKAAVALLAAGLLSAGGAVWQALPAAADDSGLTSFELHATSHGFQVLLPAGDSANVEGDVPQADAALAAGPIGSGLATILWPGATGANAGALLQVLQPGCTVGSQTGLPIGSPVCPLPEQASQLNYPVKAEAKTGQDPPTSSFDAAPGVSLKATALPALVEALAHVQNASSSGFSLGTVSATARTRTDDTAVLSEADSTSQNINIGGVLKIQSVVSTAKASVDGGKGTGDAVTTVSGVTIADQPVAIDQNGVHFTDQKGVPLGAVATQIIQQALGASGMTITVTAPEKKISGGKVEMHAGVLVIGYKTDSGPFTITFGGATATAESGPGLGDLTSFDDGSLAGTGDLGTTGDVGSVGDLGTSPVDTGTTPAGNGNGEVALGPTEEVAAGRPIKPGAVIFGVLAAGLLALGMRRLGDGVLAEQAGTTCPLDGEGS